MGTSLVVAHVLNPSVLRLLMHWLLPQSTPCEPPPNFRMAFTWQSSQGCGYPCCLCTFSYNSFSFHSNFCKYAWLQYCEPEVGVSHIHASHTQVSSLNLQVSSKSQVAVMKISQVIAITQASQVESCLWSSKSQEVPMNVFFISVDTVNRRGWSLHAASLPLILSATVPLLHARLLPGLHAPHHTVAEGKVSKTKLTSQYAWKKKTERKKEKPRLSSHLFQK